ncbi:uncharacterized protein K444DRAFT_699337 [Hyaloscypha bicolor E]|uniref:PAN-3 domain-containing protein n=1 Tax=Hyaloscypha bicolor E TaxID=1095630 RepID=A0A2J6SSQ0_9HELO|nr:uncharacterized protein K444DRAFT_699337 [Hyaloscypha bicolor E]PMD53811.1 hypothetical protein K444DRAFT_699337 [Hyaloscypha bicolor E]
MPSFTSIVFAIAAALSVATSSPLAARDICGAPPTGTAAQTPLAEPADITTAALCLAQCQAHTGCECFLFGFVNNVYTCELFSVPASAIPPAIDLVAYDIDCSNVPTVVPTASNPTGVNQKRQNIVSGATHDNPQNGIPAAGQAPLTTPNNIGSLDACLAACRGNPACIAYTFISGVCNLYA